MTLRRRPARVLKSWQQGPSSWGNGGRHVPPLSALTPVGDHRTRAAIENQLGLIYRRGGDTGQALRHYQQSLQHKQARGDIYAAGRTRYNIALLFAGDGRVSDALLYARAALDNFQQAGPGAVANAANAERLITGLEQRIH
jgi:tetratricopeptide (TPR) repeat protein